VTIRCSRRGVFLQLIDLLVNWIIGGLALFWKFRKRFIAATYA